MPATRILPWIWTPSILAGLPLWQGTQTRARAARGPSLPPRRGTHGGTAIAP